MNLMKRIGTLCLLGLLLAAVLYQQPARGHKLQPQEIYHQAWRLVKDNYYDADYNGVKWKSFEHKFDSQINTTEDAHRYIKVMLQSLKDPYTRFLDPRAFKDENDAIDARIVGIGIHLKQSEDKARLEIVRTIEDGPAERAGVRSGDEIVGIDGYNSVGFTPEQAADKIRGESGTQVCLRIKRESQLKDITITRQQINIKAVRHKILENNIGLIQLTTFISNDASREFKQALRALSKTDGLILDLRDNPGGLLSNSLEIADMLLEGGPIVSTISRHGRQTDIATGCPLTRQPLVVLIDEESASASEILASALRDNKRAILVGTKTYGKGLVQEINRLPGGAAVHITVSRYLTPSGRSINKIGVQPDITVTNRDAQMKVAMTYMKERIASLKQPLKTSHLSLTNR